MTESSARGLRIPSAESGRDRIYDPLRRENLGRSVLWALVSSKPVPLGDIPDFRGSGIYAIYYAGPNKLYARISSAKCDIPIYVGKADPAGSRKGQNVGAAWEGTKLRDRLRQHARKIGTALKRVAQRPNDLQIQPAGAGQARWKTVHKRAVDHARGGQIRA